MRHLPSCEADTRKPVHPLLEASGPPVLLSHVTLAAHVAPVAVTAATSSARLAGTCTKAPGEAQSQEEQPSVLATSAPPVTPLVAVAAKRPSAARVVREMRDANQVRTL